jgi:hypothetical protein
MQTFRDLLATKIGQFLSKRHGSQRPKPMSGEEATRERRDSGGRLMKAEEASRLKKILPIRLTTHPGQPGVNPTPMKWGAETSAERGPIVVRQNHHLRLSRVPVHRFSIHDRLLPCSNRRPTRSPGSAIPLARMQVSSKEHIALMCPFKWAGVHLQERMPSTAR